MSKKFTDEEMDNEFVKWIYDTAVDYFCNGIYIPTPKDDGHPCGWDFIDFTMVDPFDAGEDNIFVYKFGGCEISNGYGADVYQDKTLLEILKIIHGQVAFELNQIDW